MSFTYSHHLQLTISGESHGKAILLVLDNLPAGIPFPAAEIEQDLARRRPIQGFAGHTSRREGDQYEILGGMYNGHTNGGPLTVIFPNKDVDSSSYLAMRDVPRPSHADYPAGVKYCGFNDPRGGGFFSGRMTVALVFAGAFVKAVLREKGIEIMSHFLDIGNLTEPALADELITDEIRQLVSGQVFLNEDKNYAAMELFAELRKKGDSVGGRLECWATQVPVGWGEPFFHSLESVLASLIFSIPGVKAVEFGLGRGFARSFGSEVADEYSSQDGKVKTLTNNNGGILGGLSNGSNIVTKVTFKPTPSIALPLASVDMKSGSDAVLEIAGRHDVCIALRGRVVVEAIMALALWDAYLGHLMLDN